MNLQNIDFLIQKIQWFNVDELVFLNMFNPSEMFVDHHCHLQMASCLISRIENLNLLNLMGWVGV